MKYYQAAQQCNVIRFIATLFVLLLMLVLVFVPVKPTIDEEIACRLSIKLCAIWFLLLWQAPNIYLRHKQYSRHQIKRLKTLCALNENKKATVSALVIPFVFIISLPMMTAWISKQIVATNLFLLLLKDEISRPIFYGLCFVLLDNVRTYCVLKRKIQQKHFQAA